MTASPGPSISVIIPTLQEEKYILRTLRHLTPEIKSRFNCEIIVSDGGSTDGTVALVRRYADMVEVHRGPCRQTISIGRNVGARCARGRILVFLNADTHIEKPDVFFSKMSELFSGKTDIVAATCSVWIYPEEETVSDKIVHAFFNNYSWMLNIIGLGMGRGECQAIRSDVFKRVGGYKASLVAGEDFELFVRLRKLGRIAFVRNLRVFESPRRFRRFGYRKILWLWLLNSISVLCRGRSSTDEWEPVR